MFSFYSIGGLVLGLIFSAATMPATVWTTRVAINKGFVRGSLTAIALALSQFIWVFFVGQLLLNSVEPFFFLDPLLRLAFPLFFLWMAFSVKDAGSVDRLALDNRVSCSFKRTLTYGFRMPWRWALWIGLIVGLGIHLRAPGFWVASSLAVGAVLGIFVWNIYFVILAVLFAKRVPEPIILKSLNKLRFLSFSVFLGLSLLIFAPLITYL